MDVEAWFKIHEHPLTKCIYKETNQDKQKQSRMRELPD